MKRIVDLIRGWFGTIGDNELELVSTMSDPVKLRLAIEENKVESNLGGISYNTRRVDGSNAHDERALAMGRLRADKIGGAYYIAVSPSQHESVKEVFYVDNDVAIFRVPVQAPGMATASGGASLQNGPFQLHLQGDGNLVLYDTRSNPWVALWASGTVVL